jgi:hypothetical protein
VGGDCGHQESRRRLWWKVLELFARWRAEFKPPRARDLHHLAPTRWKKGTSKPPLMHFGGRGGMGLAAKAKAFQRPPLATTWPQQGHNMATTRPQHGLNTATTWPQHAKRQIDFFAQNFLPKLQKKLSLMFRHSYLACLLFWRTPLPFRLGWR